VPLAQNMGETKETEQPDDSVEGAGVSVTRERERRGGANNQQKK
jgi:hypothetical protein